MTKVSARSIGRQVSVSARQPTPRSSTKLTRRRRRGHSARGQGPYQSRDSAGAVPQPSHSGITRRQILLNFDCRSRGDAGTARQRLGLLGLGGAEQVTPSADKNCPIHRLAWFVRLATWNVELGQAPAQASAVAGSASPRRGVSAGGRARRRSIHRACWGSSC